LVGHGMLPSVLAGGVHAVGRRVCLGMSNGCVERRILLGKSWSSVVLHCLGARLLRPGLGLRGRLRSIVLVIQRVVRVTLGCCYWWQTGGFGRGFLVSA